MTTTLSELEAQRRDALAKLRERRDVNRKAYEIERLAIENQFAMACDQLARKAITEADSTLPDELRVGAPVKSV